MGSRFKTEHYSKILTRILFVYILLLLLYLPDSSRLVHWNVLEKKRKKNEVERRENAPI